LSTGPSLGLSKNADIVDIYIAALGALITDIKKTGSGQTRYELENGARVDFPQGEALYAFPFADEAELFEDAQVSVEIQGQRVDGSIVSISAGKLLLAISGDHGSLIHRAVLLIDAIALLEALKEKLEKTKGGEIAVNRSFSDAVVGRADLPPNPDAIPSHSLSNRLKAKQLQALHRALCASVTRIWGPPGSGKTTTLAAIVRSALEANKRLLICSNTNKALDQLLLKVCDELGSTHMAMEEGRVVRVGRIADDLLQEKYAYYVSIEGIISRLSHELEQRKRVIQESISEVDAKTVKARQVFEWFAKLDAVTSQIRDLSKQEEAKRKQHQKVVDDSNRLEKRLGDLAEEMKKRQRSRFGLFQRSIDEITRNIAEVKGVKEKQWSSLVEVRALLEEIKERQVTTQRDYDQLNTTLRTCDRNAAQKEIAEAEKLRGSLIKELREIETKIAELSASIMRGAKVIGATCTKTYLSSKEFGQFDLVLIDEVSMIIPPIIWFISGFSRERVVVCGDPRQLPPIVPTEQEAVFDVLGHDVLENHENDEGTVQLSIQYRMNSAICDLISGPMYDGKLQTEVVNPQSPNISPPEPFNGTLTIIDTSDLWPFESVTAFRSRFNLMHALLARNLAWHLNRSGYINGGKKRLGICTPYAAQAKLIKKLLEGEGLNEQVTAGTVHRYQGDESQMMVLEIPESHGGAWTVGQFVQGVPPTHIGARLLNVAVSRAQSHLVVIANLTHLDKHLPSTSLLRSILYDMQVKGRVISGKTLLELRPIQNDLKGLLGNLKLDVQAESLGIFDEKNFDAAIREDFIKAKKGVVIFSGFVTPRRVAEYGELFRMKIAEGVKVRCVTRSPYLNGSIPPSAGKQALDALEGIGCVVDCRSRIHQKVVLIDNEIVWHGSLNTLSHAHITEESMTRLVNAGLAQALAASMAKRRYSGEKAAGQVTQPENPRCERCGSRTVYADGRYGPYFYCENSQADTKCDWSISMIRAERERFRNGLSREERDPKRDQQGRRSLQGVQEKKRKASRRR
jgi:superfamily I DNA and/or RNA helicase